MTEKSTPSDSLSQLAPAKLNLYLHITGRRDDGYHLLDSLVVFADYGDTVSASEAEQLSLTIDGPFGSDVPDGEENLVLKAARLLAQNAGITKGADLHLTANVVVTKNECTHLAEVLITARMVRVQMGVHEKTDRLAGQRPDRRNNLVRKRRKLVVNKKHSVVADKQADVSSTTLDVVNLPCHRMDVDLDFIEVLGNSNAARV